MTLLYPVIGIFYAFCFAVKIAYLERIIRGAFNNLLFACLVSPFLLIIYLALLAGFFWIFIMIGALGWFFLMYRLAFVSRRISPEP